MEETGAGLYELLRAFAALIFVLGLMGAFAFLAKRMGLSGGVEASIKRKGRLKLVEALPLDARRRLVIISRDDKEHLVILGPNQETVVEAGFSAPDNKDHEE
ncbi:MAG: hypothetical protein CBB87_11955 [Micavibrio sp. TMED27]|nr:hypothetical protein [Micavibrio sp.]OUT89682.1 MAG: hypothetical protein CBB87_11955 [Micavibrio sp. TMED27]|tara:strand:- start:1397 stop:1702 length:306 start_codon:yes stop_codon:yes gene_type:complete